MRVPGLWLFRLCSSSLHLVEAHEMGLERGFSTGPGLFQVEVWELTRHTSPHRRTSTWWTGSSTSSAFSGDLGLGVGPHGMVGPSKQVKFIRSEHIHPGLAGIFCKQPYDFMWIGFIEILYFHLYIKILKIYSFDSHGGLASIINHQSELRKSEKRLCLKQLFQLLDQPQGHPQWLPFSSMHALCWRQNHQIHRWRRDSDIVNLR